MNAQELAKEIVEDVMANLLLIGSKEIAIQSAAAKLEPLVSALEQSHGLVVDAIMHGMPITKDVAKARNDAVAILGKRGDQ